MRKTSRLILKSIVLSIKNLVNTKDIDPMEDFANNFSKYSNCMKYKGM